MAREMHSLIFLLTHAGVHWVRFILLFFLFLFLFFRAMIDSLVENESLREWRVKIEQVSVDLGPLINWKPLCNPLSDTWSRLVNRSCLLFSSLLCQYFIFLLFFNNNNNISSFFTLFVFLAACDEKQEATIDVVSERCSRCNQQHQHHVTVEKKIKKSTGDRIHWPRLL